MQNKIRLLSNGYRRAIQLPDGKLLAVPPFDARVTPPAVRQRIYELVLRRQPGEAEIHAQIAAEAKVGGSEHDRLAAMMGTAPHRVSLMELGAA